MKRQGKFNNFFWLKFYVFSDFCAPKSVILTISKAVTQCGKMRNSLSPKKYFVKSTLFVKPLLSRNLCKKVISTLKKLLKSWFHEIIFWWERISHFSTLCTMWKKIHCHPIFFVKSIKYKIDQQKVDFKEFLVAKFPSPNFNWFNFDFTNFFYSFSA